MSLISIVVPVYHNARSLPDLVARLQQLAEREPEDFEFIFVDDGSHDSSFAVLEDLSRREPRVRAIKLARNFGANIASSAGIAYSRGDAIVAISADLQDPPELIGKMLERWRAGYRIVLAARSERHDPLLTTITSNLFWRLFRQYAIPTMPEMGCDFCLVDRLVLESLEETHEPNAGVAMLLWTGFEPAMIYYSRGPRAEHYGRSRWNWSKRLTYLIDSFVSFSHLPIRAASLLGIGLATLGFLYAIFVVVSKLAGWEQSEAWASLMVALLVVSGMQLFMMGILGEYLVRTLDAARRRPSFVIERMVEHGNDLTPDDVRSNGTTRRTMRYVPHHTASQQDAAELASQQVTD